MTPTAASTLFCLMGQFPPGTGTEPHPAQALLLLLRAPGTWKQSPGAPPVQSILCKHLQHHSQPLLETSDIHMPAMQTALNLNTSWDISELPWVLFPWDNPTSTEVKHNHHSVMAGRRSKHVCKSPPSHVGDNHGILKTMSDFWNFLGWILAFMKTAALRELHIKNAFSE